MSADAPLSHPAVKYRNIPTLLGPLADFNQKRTKVLTSLVKHTTEDILKQDPDLDLMLSEALYVERLRIKKTKWNFFTKKRRHEDEKLLGRLQAGVLAGPALSNREDLLKLLITHYAEEIGGHFDPNVYRFSTRVVPFFFSWLLNAASVGKFAPWKMTESLQSRLTVVGEIPHLQKLSQKGTLLIVPTHQSNIDSILIGYVIYLMQLPPFAYGAGLNLFLNPVLSFFMSRLGAYTVDRSKNHPFYKETLKNYSSEILREGIHSIFFPGGGRSRSGAIEKKLKLGLLGTALEATTLNRIENHPKPDVFIVPMVMSYHFVLEASSLIEDFLLEQGKHRVILSEDEGWAFKRLLKFFWQLFSVETGITARIGRPLDVFGNFVDEEGKSLGPNGTLIDPAKLLTTRGKLSLDPQRDREYTRLLGERLVDRFHAENTVLSSHLVAYTFFQVLRKKYPDLDIFRFLRLSSSQRTLSKEEFYKQAEINYEKLKKAAEAGKLYLSYELSRPETQAWVEHGIKNLGVFHEAKVIVKDEHTLSTEDMNLLYYYRNRLDGYRFLE